MSRTTLFLSLATLLALFGVAGAQTDDGSPVAFRDSYTRDDAAPPQDSLGTTESGDGLAVLDYREIDADGADPGVDDVAALQGQALVVAGLGTNPAYVELAGVSRDLELDLVGEFLVSDLSGFDAANCMTLGLRNTGVAPGGSLHTPGMILIELDTNGIYEIRAVWPDAGGVVLLVQARLDPATFSALDVDGDGLLEEGEPFRMHVMVEDNWLDFLVEDVPQVENLDLSFLPQPPTGNDRLLLGRNTRNADGTPLSVRFDDLSALAEGEVVDADGDGFPEGEDCDDQDPSVYPGAEEVCDGLDNDCDGSVSADELDGDGDGLATCDGDCDDTNAAINPDAVDLPGNAVDENCDGVAVCDSSAYWRNHGQYVKCVVHESRKLKRRGEITKNQKRDLVRDAARSDVGRRGGSSESSSGGGRGNGNGGGR